jgi:hypothetical protein
MDQEARFSAQASFLAPDEFRIRVPGPVTPHEAEREFVGRKILVNAVIVHLWILSFRLPGTTNQELTESLELRCDVSMLRRLWRRIVEHHRRVNAELEQIELELGREESRFPLLPPFPQKPYKASTIALFFVFGFFVAFAALVCLKELVISFFR